MDNQKMDENRNLDAESFGEWLQQVSESQGMSEQELLHELMSSYWMMDELSNVMDEISLAEMPDIEEQLKESDAGLSDRESSPQESSESNSESTDTPSEQAEVQPPSSLNVDPGVLSLINALRDWNSGSQSEQPSIDRNLIDLIQAIQEGGAPAQAAHQSTGASTSSSSQDTIELIKALKEFGESSNQNVAAQGQSYQVAQLDQQVRELNDGLEKVSDRVGEVDQRTQQRTQRLTQAIEELASRVATVQERLDEAPESAEGMANLESSIDELSDELNTVHEQTESKFESVESQFDRVEQILTHLFNRVDENDERMEKHGATLSEIQSSLGTLTDFEEVSELKRKANQAGAVSADCHSCGESVDIGLLSEAECPHCSANFEDVETKSSWFSTKHTLV